MSDDIRIEADGEDGVVMIFTDPQTATELAAMWEYGHSVKHGFKPGCHELFLLEAGILRRAAIAAELPTALPPVISRAGEVVKRGLRLVGGVR